MSGLMGINQVQLSAFIVQLLNTGTTISFTNCGWQQVVISRLNGPFQQFLRKSWFSLIAAISCIYSIRSGLIVVFSLGPRLIFAHTTTEIRLSAESEHLRQYNWVSVNFQWASNSSKAWNICSFWIHSKLSCLRWMCGKDWVRCRETITSQPDVAVGTLNLNGCHYFFSPLQQIQQGVWKPIASADPSLEVCS